MGLFSDIYNTVAKFFRPQDEPIIGEASKAVATNRLKLVLMQDRTNLTPKVLEQMRGELVDLLSKYLEMDKDMLELNFEQEGDQVALMLSIPVIRAKDEDEIEGLAETTEEISEQNESEEDSDEFNEETAEITEEEKESDDVTVVSEEAPKKKRSKKVTPPEEMESNNEDSQESHNEENITIE